MNSYIKSLVSFCAIIFSSSLSAAFVTTWETNETNQTFEIGISFDNSDNNEYMNILWGDETEENITLKGVYPSHTYIDANTTYEIKIQSFNGAKMKLELGVTNSNAFVKSIDKWSDSNGSADFNSLEKAFYNCFNLDYNATDAPDLTNVDSTANMFNGIKTFSGDISSWNTTNIVDMNNMFTNIKTFDQNLSSWDVSSVKDMSRMFKGVEELNVSTIIDWNTSSATNLSDMFSNSSFDENLSAWCIVSNANMEGFFKNTFLSKENLLAVLTSWVIQADTNVTVDIGKKATIYRVDANESNRTININGNNITIFKDTAYYSDYNYTEIAPFLKSLVKEQNWTISENGILFLPLSLIPNSTISTIEDFENITQTIRLRGDINDRNNTRFITYNIDINDTEILDFNRSGSSVVFSSKKDKFGSVRVDFNVSDGYFNDSTYFYFNISNVDDKPSIDKNIVLQDTNLTLVYNIDYNSYTIKGILEDSSPFTFDINVTDVDGDDINYTVESYNTNIVTLSIDKNARVTVTPLPNASGRVKIAIKAIANSKSVIQSYWIDIVGNNDAPTIEFISLSDMSIAEDNGTNIFDINVTDIDGDDLNLSIESNNTLLIQVATSWDTLLNRATYQNKKFDFNLTTVKDAHGEAKITVKLSDDINTTIVSYNINVTSVYDSFSIEPIADKIKEKNFTPFIVNMDVNDADVIGNIDYSVVYDNSKIAVVTDATSKTLTITPVTNAIGKTDVNITATYSAQSSSETIDFTIDIVDVTVEDLPNCTQDKNVASCISRFKTIIRSDINASRIIEGDITKLVKDNANVSMSILGKTTAKIADISMYSDLNATETLLTMVDNLFQITTSFAHSILTLKSDNTTIIKQYDSQVNSKLPLTFTTIKDNGEIEMRSGKIDSGDYFINALVSSKIDGSVMSRFIKVLKSDNNNISFLLNAVFIKTPYSNGTKSEVKMINGELFIKTTATLDKNLVVN